MMEETFTGNEELITSCLFPELNCREKQTRAGKEGAQQQKLAKGQLTNKWPEKFNMDDNEKQNTTPTLASLTIGI